VQPEQQVHKDQQVLPELKVQLVPKVQLERHQQLLVQLDHKAQLDQQVRKVQLVPKVQLERHQQSQVQLDRKDQQDLLELKDRLELKVRQVLKAELEPPVLKDQLDRLERKEVHLVP
jgi:hypothetical protein